MRAVPDLPLVFTVHDLRRRGVTGKQAEYRVARGVWHRLRRGVFCTAEAWQRAGAEGRHVLTAAATVAGARAPQSLVLSHTTAAALHELPVPAGRLKVVTLTSPRGADRATGDDRRVYVAGLPQADVETRHGIPVTTVHRTVADCLRHLPVGDAVAVADAAVREGATTVEDLRTVLAAQTGWPFSAAAALRLELVDGRRESPLESRSAVVMAAHGIPRPRLQCRIVDSHGVVVARVDFAWLEVGVVGEADGQVKYRDGAPGVLRREKDRHAILESLGLVVVRWDERHLHGVEPVLVTRLRAGFARADPRRFLGRAA